MAEGFGLPNLASLFRPSTQTTPTAGATPAAPAAGTPNPADNGMTVANPGAGAGTTDGAAGATGTPKKESSPLDAFESVFKIDDKATPPKDPMAEPLFKVDPKTLADAVNRMDFAKHVSPEVVQKILGGDSAALQQALNGSSRAVFMQAVQMLSGVMQGAFNTNNQRYDSVLSSKFRSFQINSSPTQNKALQHPAAQPVLSAIRDQISRQEPNLAPHEVTKKAEDYFLAMSKAVGSVAEETDQTARRSSSPGGQPADDWTKYLESGETRQEK